MSWIPSVAWTAYVKRLAALNNRAAEEMRRYITERGFEDTEALITYAYGLSTKYGEGAAALAAEMYDEIAALEGKLLPAAIPADTATLSETAAAVKKVLTKSRTEEMLSAAVGRLVKRAGADTTLKNAVRDGAQFAWVPMGDTCAFCITLASNGWQRAGKKTLNQNHAPHIHANCDCTYAVRFSETTQVRGYDPDKYRAMYENAPLDHWNTPDGKPPEGHASAEKPTAMNRIKAMRRELYAENKDKINEQKRSAYAKRVELNSPAAEEADV